MNCAHKHALNVGKICMYKYIFFILRFSIAMIDWF